MVKTRHTATTMFLIVILITSMAAAQARAEGGPTGEDAPLRLKATATAGPIGLVANSLLSRDAVLVDGRAAYGEQLLWGGELIQAPAGKSISMSFDSIGKVTMAGGAAARFASVASTAEGGRVLVATLIAGDIRLKLEPSAGAYVEAAGSTFTASRGASFSLTVSNNQASLKTISGAVQQDQSAAQRRYVLRPIGSGSTISVRARSTRQLQIQVTDENDRSVPDLPILFLLTGAGGQSTGTLGAGATAATSATVTTNSQGIATITFNAPASASQNTITATVQGTRYSHTWEVSITAATTGFWSLRNSLIVAGAAAAGATTIAIAATGDDDEPIRPVPPPVVRPQIVVKP